MAAFTAILRKDLRLELRSGDSTIALAFLSLLILIVLVFALNPAGGDRGVAAGALWVALVFAGMLGATRALTDEWENGCIRALLASPADHAAIYCAKLLASFIFMTIAEIAVVAMMVLFFNFDFTIRLLRLAPIVAMGALGFAALATLLAAVRVRVRGGDLLLPLLAVPVFIPALIAGVKATDAALAGLAFARFVPWLKILAACDVLFVAAGYVLFEHVVRED
jgi:heme exporter protein B